jgi:predicted transcriptional regulator
MFDHPEGVQKINLRKDLGLVSNTQVQAHKLLFENKLIEIAPNPVKMTFVLTEKGKLIAEKLKEIKQKIEQ